MAATKVMKKQEPGNGAGSSPGGKKHDVDLSVILPPEQVALHRAGFEVLIPKEIKQALLGEGGRTGENREYLISIGKRERTLRKVKNGRAVRYILSEVLKEQERLIRESA